jgi:hypothetical protein
MTKNEKIIEKALADISLAEGFLENAKMQYRAARKQLESISKPKPKKNRFGTPEEIARAYERRTRRITFI